MLQHWCRRCKKLISNSVAAFHLSDPIPIVPFRAFSSSASAVSPRNDINGPTILYLLSRTWRSKLSDCASVRVAISFQFSCFGTFFPFFAS